MIDHALLQIAEAARSNRGAHLAGEAQASLLERAAAVTAAAQQVVDAPHQLDVRLLERLRAGDRSLPLLEIVVDALLGVQEAQDALIAVVRHGAPAPRRVPSKRTLSRAAEHLRVHAEELRASHTVRDVWGTEPDDLMTRAEVEDMFALADALDPQTAHEQLPKPTNPPT